MRVQRSILLLLTLTLAIVASGHVVGPPRALTIDGLRVQIPEQYDSVSAYLRASAQQLDTTGSPAPVRASAEFSDSTRVASQSGFASADRNFVDRSGARPKLAGPLSTAGRPLESLGLELLRQGLYTAPGALAPSSPAPSTFLR